MSKSFKGEKKKGTGKKEGGKKSVWAPSAVHCTILKKKKKKGT